MKIANFAPQSPTIEPETIKPTSSSKPSAEAAHEPSEEAAVTNKSSSPTLPKRPLDDPLSRGFLQEKLGGGSQGSSPTTPSIRMDKSDPDDPSGTGWDVGGSDAPESLDHNKSLYPQDDSSTEGSGHGVGFNLSARPHFLDGEGHSKAATSGPAGSSATGSTSGTDSGGTQSSTTSKPPVKKK
jgi:hypothetical protein